MSVQKIPFIQITESLIDSNDNSKRAILSFNDIPTNTTVILNLPNENTNLVGDNNIQNLTNKTIIGPSNNVQANSLSTNNQAVDISNTIPPINGFVLTAESQTIAVWKQPTTYYFSTASGVPPTLRYSNEIKQWHGTSTSLNGTSQFFITLNGSAGGPPIFDDLVNAYMQVSGRRDSTDNTEIPFCSVRSISGNTVTVNVRSGNTGGILIGGTYAGLQNAPNGSIVYLSIYGI